MVNFRYYPRLAPVERVNLKCSFKMNIQSFALLYVLTTAVSLSTAEFKSVRKPDFGYATFRRFQNSKLLANNTSIMYVDDLKQCAVGCTLNLTCKSFNMATQPVLTGQKFVCELIPVDMFNNSSSFENSTNPNFLHYSIQVRTT